ncbi:LmbU family transcriptional regulator [Micromonospora sp. HUAS LYJ1]|uniref:LmbU family transcriptional regulator n=1 Tax=Micromonospora sp. HUAS LYJ1 TaxID=3061626 RepID=UPI00267279C2|nr:LmbU family transcriptional regulator [Micromonospora sp. HUAS LYJ1]WKU05357.1 LmbU family transcriptional regulator [Micromonospora sp. HUAS LYJ1]
MTPTGLRIPSGLDFEGWQRAGYRLAQVVNSSAWCIGDWIVHGQQRYTDRYQRAVEMVGLEYKTVRNYASTARRFPHARRREALSFQHHAEVAGLSEDQQEMWLDRAENLRWSRNKLRLSLRAARNEGGEDKAAAVAIPRIAADRDRVLRWQAAAQRSRESFEHWIVAMLDEAAAACLDEPA